MPCTHIHLHAHTHTQTHSTVAYVNENPPLAARFKFILKRGKTKRNKSIKNFILFVYFVRKRNQKQKLNSKTM